MARQEAERPEMTGIVGFKLDESCTCVFYLIIARFPDRLIRLPRLDLVPGKLTVPVLKKNILMLLAEHLDHVLGIIKHHATDDGGPCPLKPVPARGLMSGIILGDGLVWSKS